MCKLNPKSKRRSKTSKRPLSPSDILDEWEIWNYTCESDSVGDRLWSMIYGEPGDEENTGHPELDRMTYHMHQLLSVMTFMMAKQTGWKVSMLKEFSKAKKSWQKNKDD